MPTTTPSGESKRVTVCNKSETKGIHIEPATGFERDGLSAMYG
jgi:hypothetical protein